MASFPNREVVAPPNRLVLVLPGLLLALVVLSDVVIQVVREVGPLDSGKLRGLVTLPLLVAVSGVAAVLLSRPRTRSVRVAMAAYSVGVAALVTWYFATSMTLAGCYIVATPWQALPNAAIVGSASGVSFCAASLIAGRIAPIWAERREMLAFALGVGAWVPIYFAMIVAAYFAGFIGIACRPPF